MRIHCLQHSHLGGEIHLPVWAAERGYHWASSIVPLLRGAATGDRVARRHLAKLTRVQLSFQAHTRTLALVAKLRSMVSR